MVRYRSYKLGVEKVPDATIYFRESTSQVFNAKLQVNDMILAEYHKNNAFTKISFKMSKLLKAAADKWRPIQKERKNEDITWPLLRITEAYMKVMDMITRNLLHYYNPKVFLMTSYAYMTADDAREKFVRSIYYLIGSLIVPTSLSNY